VVPNSQQVQHSRPGNASELISLLVGPFDFLTTVIRTVGRLSGGLVAAMLALPRIADTLERLAPADQALRELAKLQSTLDRLDQLGTFVAQELPEVQHQIETLRTALVTSAARVAEFGQQLAATATVGTALDESITLLITALGLAEPAESAKR
jgi:septal ring factor EnvC (AmiA/AmiB activator)